MNYKFTHIYPTTYILLLINVVLTILTYILENDIFLYGSIVVSLAYLPKIKLLFRSSILMIVTLLLLFGAFVNSFITSNGFGGVIVIFSTILITLAFIQLETKNKYLFPLIGFLIVWGNFFIKLFIFNIPAHQLLINTSQNRAGMLVLVWAIFSTIVYYYEFKKVLLLPSIMSAFLSFFLLGRSTIITSLLFVIATILFRYFTKFSFKRLFNVSLVIFVLAYLFNTYIYEIIFETNFYRFGLDTPRFEIWGAYLNNLTFTDLFLGVDMESLPVVSLYGHTHNSFLKFHSRIGIFIIGFIVLIIKSQFINLKYGYVFPFFLFLVLAARIFTDNEFLIGGMDFILYYFLYYPIKNIHYAKKNRRVYLQNY